MAQAPVKRQKTSGNKVVFASYVLDDFNFDKAKEEFKTTASLENVPDTFEPFRKAYKQVSNDKPWPFVLPYMYGHITDNSTGFKGPGYYNYVLGYHNEKPGKLVLRIGYYDEQAAQTALVEASKVKSKSSAQTVIGIKHMQLGSIDLDIVFAGVLIVEENNNAIVSPMSGTWLEIMQKYIQQNNMAGITQCEAKDLMNALNIMNIICTSHAISQLSKQEPKQDPEVTVMSCCEKTYTCKYAKLACKPPTDKICQSISKQFPTLSPDLKCANARLDANQRKNETPIECFKDIPEIIASKKKSSL